MTAQVVRLVPSNALVIDEKTWMTYPFIRTIITIPFFNKVCWSTLHCSSADNASFRKQVVQFVHLLIWLELKSCWYISSVNNICFALMGGGGTVEDRNVYYA
jgi:hypothetical protein